MIVTLAGGVGAARFLEGLVQVVPAEQVTAIVNTGDDITLHGLHISPDIDIVTYTLAGIVEEAQGWGVRGDTTNVLEMLKTLGAETWFLLGDRDLATHIRRTELLRGGATLTEVTDLIRRALGVAVQILPMTDDPVATYIVTPQGAIHFQHYLVQRRAQDDVTGVTFEGVDRARPTAVVLEAIGYAEAILIAPSNPIVSVGTTLALPGVRAALEETRTPIVAVSPIVGGAPIKGPAAPLMRAQGFEVSARGVGECYRGLIDILVIDTVDAVLADDIRALGIDVVITDTIMRGPDEKRSLAQVTLDAANARLSRS
ncbi:MAG: 2-phospho-L-lactate transferase [Chloroflexi bacterium AL-W]|nr:2-phospho-L-lactate transferase [Chloroflexi bacterium AL-N1]NOK70501.1 2-phospho-L-lactate transferase [Chloroflexi bacterium AL-N10]NOK78140.1 2-phospho-L-lactate transferase [Chloroflexi bacterium AL-N5]NOK85239.1 2-phospho-L-lactate transferase [Chloroflexi bacterium AL-W]NOK92004.1 2-phospho-L-lactate transferase [Chloroflexi bacterium AL-N15]